MRRGVVWLFAALSGFLALLAAAVVALYSAVDRQAEQDETRPADVIIVLGSQVRAGGLPSGSLRARTQHAIDLYKAGYAPTLLLTGGLGYYPPAEADVMRTLALDAGVPESALVLDDRATSTQESLETAARIAPSRGWRTALIVSDPFHMLRSLQMARDLGLDAYGSPAYRSTLYTVDRLRRYYTLREAFALVWYYTLGRHGVPFIVQRSFQAIERRA
ncbi:MAG: YdcF family protein [Anaerolineae bacterium]